MGAIDGRNVRHGSLLIQNRLRVWPHLKSTFCTSGQLSHAVHYQMQWKFARKWRCGPRKVATGGACFFSSIGLPKLNRLALGAEIS